MKLVQIHRRFSFHRLVFCSKSVLDRTNKRIFNRNMTSKIIAADVRYLRPIDFIFEEEKHFNQHFSLSFLFIFPCCNHRRDGKGGRKIIVIYVWTVHFLTEKSSPVDRSWLKRNVHSIFFLLLSFLFDLDWNDAYVIWSCLIKRGKFVMNTSILTICWWFFIE